MMPVSVAATAVIGPHVTLHGDTVVGEFVILGEAFSGAGDDELSLVIGRDARIRSHSVIYAGSTIGDRFQTGHGVMIRERNEIGNDVSIGTHSIVEHHVVLGDHVRIHSNAFIPEFSVVEEGAWIGPNVVFTNAAYPLSRDAKANLRGPHLLPGAKIGANATLLPGVTIGRDALVGAGSVVVKDVPDGTVVVGNPARIVRRVEDLAAYAPAPGSTVSRGG
jgi:acetyltransferase-like isoleucine patch superfamily enzyme